MAVKDFVNDVATHTRATAMDGLLSVARFFGCEPAIESLIRRVFGKNQLPTSAEVETVINKIISTAKVKNEQELQKLQNKLNDIPLAKSATTKDAIDKEIARVRELILKRTANTGLADDLASSALNTANSISYSTASERQNLAKEAEEKAHKAAELYASDPNKVEIEIGGK